MGLLQIFSPHLYILALRLRSGRRY